MRIETIAIFELVGGLSEDERGDIGIARAIFEQLFVVHRGG